MKAITSIIASAFVILGASCGNNSTKNDTVKTDTTSEMNTVTQENSNGNTSGTLAQTITVPEPIQSTFKQKYPNVSNVTWARYEPMSTFDWEWSGWPMLDTASYMARFNMDNTDYWAWYDPDNNWVGTLSAVSDYNSLPSPVNNTIKNSYSGYTITAVDKENDKNRTAYEIDLSKSDTDKMKILIDENGNIMKKKVIADGTKTKEKQ